MASPGHNELKPSRKQRVKLPPCLPTTSLPPLSLSSPMFLWWQTPAAHVCAPAAQACPPGCRLTSIASRTTLHGSLKVTTGCGASLVIRSGHQRSLPVGWMEPQCLFPPQLMIMYDGCSPYGRELHAEIMVLAEEGYIMILVSFWLKILPAQLCQKLL